MLLTLAYEKMQVVYRARALLIEEAEKKRAFEHVVQRSRFRSIFRKMHLLQRRVTYIVSRCEALADGAARGREQKQMLVETMCLRRKPSPLSNVYTSSLLHDILKTQRRRHWIADAEAYRESRLSTAKYTTAEVRDLISRPTDKMRACVERVLVRSRKRHSQFLLLTAGGLEAIARKFNQELEEFTQNLRARKRCSLSAAYDPDRHIQQAYRRAKCHSHEDIASP
jgi:hypothetical protein